MKASIWPLHDVQAVQLNSIFSLTLLRMFQCKKSWTLGTILVEILRIKPLFTGILIAGFVLASQWSQQFFHLLNGSLSYAPALLILGSLGIYHYQQQKQFRRL